MGIDGDGGLAECRVEDHVGCFAADSGQRFQRFSCLRDLSLMLLQQDLTGVDDVLGFRIEQSNALDVALQFRASQFADCRRCIGNFEQHSGCFVDAHVRRLSGENDGNQ